MKSPQEGRLGMTVTPIDLRVLYPPPPSDLVRLLGFGAIVAVNRIEASIRTEVAVAC
jgi:hypothetical protein